MEEVICISSDEETVPRKASNIIVCDIKEGILEKNKETVDNRKRKTSCTDESPGKRAKLSRNSESATDGIIEFTNLMPAKRQSEPLTLTNGHDSTKKLNENLVTSDNCTVVQKEMHDSSNSSLQELKKPQLIVRRKVSLHNSDLTGDDLFGTFLASCLQHDSSTDMKKILAKLKKRYERLNPSYAKSRGFKRLLTKKQKCISNDGRNVYVHIGEVMDEIKARVKKDLHEISTKLTNENCDNIREIGSENSEVLPSTTNASEINEENSDTDSQSNHSVNKTLRLLEITMRLCKKRIKKLKEAEIDFDDDKDSSYMKLERYERRMVDLYDKYCELSGENPDAGRPYLRPKHLNVTPLYPLNHAITSFVNARISKRKKKKGSSFINALIFPDYADILNCIEKCNTQQNLGLDIKTREHMAKKAFHDLGEYLQRVRQHDYWDTFSLYLENEDDDPALKDQELANKLQSNRELGNKKLTQVFEEFVKKEEELKSQSVNNPDEGDEEEEEDEEEEDDEEEEEEEEEGEEGTENNDEGDEEKEKKEKAKEKEKEDEEKEKKEDGVKETEEKTEKLENVKKGDSMAEDISSKINDIKIQDEKTNENKTSAEDHNLLMDEDDCAIVLVNDIKKVKSDDIIKETEINVSRVTSITRVSTITCTAINEIEIEAEDKDNISLMEAETNEQKEVKPLLRVRSFAKPPGYWKDPQEMVDKPNASDTPKETHNQNGTSLIRAFTADKVSQSALKGTCKAVKCKSVMVPGMLNGKPVIEIKNIIDNCTVKLHGQEQPSSSNMVKLDSYSNKCRNMVTPVPSKPTTAVFQQIQHTSEPNKSVHVIPLKQKWPSKTFVRWVPAKTIHMPTNSVEENCQTSHSTSNVSGTK